MSRDRPPQEIERKFLADRMPDGLDAAPRADILQGYLTSHTIGEEVRLRRKGDRHYQTVKSSGTLARTEFEIELTMSQFEELWPATEGRRLDKTRYEIHHGGVLIELDIYRGELAGLITAEVEFESRQQSQSFTPPAWFGREITDDHRYKNRNLALAGLPDETT